MPIPVPVPVGPLPITDSINTRAEQILSALIQVTREGTTGTVYPPTPTTPPYRFIGSDGNFAVPGLGTEDEQLLYRHLALVLCGVLAPYASSTSSGVINLSSDPSNPDFPIALNAEEVSTTPAPNKIPRAYATGLLDPGWIGGTGGSVVPDSVFTATCTASDVVGDLVRVTGASKYVTKVNPLYTAQMPAIGVIIEKSSSTACSVQCSDLVQGVYTGLTPGKLLFVGTNGRPTHVRPSPSVGSEILVQPIGFALDTNMVLMSPGTNITRLKG